MNLGLAHKKGLLGLKEDPAKANELWERAARTGDAMALYNLAQSHLFGSGGYAENKERAARLFEQVVRVDPSLLLRPEYAGSARHFLAYIRFHGEGNARKDPAAAERWAREAAYLGNIKAMVLLAEIVEARGGEIVESCVWYALAADLGDEEAAALRGLFDRRVLTEEDEATIRAGQKSFADEAKPHFDRIRSRALGAHGWVHPEDILPPEVVVGVPLKSPPMPDAPPAPGPEAGARAGSGFVGTWTADMEKFLAELEKQSPGASALMKGGSMEITISADGTYRSKVVLQSTLAGGQVQETSGEWRVENGTLRLRQTHPSPEEKPGVGVLSADGSRIVVKTPGRTGGEMEITFLRR